MDNMKFFELIRLVHHLRVLEDHVASVALGHVEDDCRIKKTASAEAKKRGFEARKRRMSRRAGSQNKGKSGYSLGTCSPTLSGKVSSGPNLGYSHIIEVLPDSDCTNSLIDKAVVF
ncbi:hypothetical protein ADUPG1_012141 [Aduncisulcus paluster]|uniref:Uncharacterized protein n=1 Tax=Aduncisulcus paluster TaxID=2918883 RepID=A0ABQ5K1P4_9EUKA|nr:hypothetical protein ADUPG1_012141 [Aduncisulcus paluster]